MNKVFYTICFFVVSNQIFSQTQLGSDIDGDAGDALGYGLALSSNGQVIANWQGLVGQEEDWQGKLAPGSYVVNTTMDSGVLTEQNLYIQPFENLRIEGHILLSIGLIAIAFLEPVVKNKLSKLIPNTTTKGPLVKKNPFKTNTEGMPEDDGFDDEDPWRSPIIN